MIITSGKATRFVQKKKKRTEVKSGRRMKNKINLVFQFVGRRTMLLKIKKISRSVATSIVSFAIALIFQFLGQKSLLFIR